MNDTKMRVIPATGEVTLNQGELADDLLAGADAIARFIFGDPRKRRRVYHLVQTRQLPVFRMGALVCARKSSLVKWVEHQESQATVP